MRAILLATLFVISSWLYAAVANAENARAMTIIALGDSLTAGYGLGVSEGFVPSLSRELEKLSQTDENLNGIKIINAGVSGDTTSGALSRLLWSVPETADAVIVALGGNDALRAIAPEITEENLEKIISSLQARGQAVFLIGMRAPPNLGGAYTQAFDALYPRLAKKYGLAYYPFFLDGVAGQLELNLNDGIHPNAQGIAEIIKRVTPSLVAFVKSLEITD